MLRSIAEFFGSLSVTTSTFLEREAGYQVVSFSLIVFGVIISDPEGRHGIAHDLVVFGLGVMARSMGGTKKPVEALPPGSTTVETKGSSVKVTEIPEEMPK